jgi:hypothetical protein
MTGRGLLILARSPARASSLRAASSVAVIVLISLSFSCAADPVHDRQIAALGGETSGIPRGPLHRAGQPCGVCHGAEGPDSPEFSLAGTLYREPSSREPLAYASVHFIDSTGEQRWACTNSVGTFFVLKKDWSPSWPVWSKIYLDESAEMPLVAEMTAAIFRETSCSTCHADPASPSTVGHLYLAEKSMPLPEGTCR